MLTDPETTARIFRIVGVGGVAIVPTDTVYGLIADATNEKAIEKIFVIKKRDIRKPLGIFVRDRDMLKEYILADENLLDKLFSIWPGALTAILVTVFVLRLKERRIKIRILLESGFPLARF